MPRSLYPRKEIQFPFYRRLGGYRVVWMGVDKTKSFTTIGF
jgi:hypothetical protein